MPATSFSVVLILARDFKDVAGSIFIVILTILSKIKTVGTLIKRFAVMAIAALSQRPTA